MNARLVGWLMLAVWAGWIAAAQGLLAAQPVFARLVPDALLCLFLACAARFESADLPKVALLCGMARVAYSIEPPAAILAGFLAAAFGVRAVASVADLDGASVRTVLAGIVGYGLSAWLFVVHEAREGATGELGPELLAQLPGALATAALAFLAGPALARLPGLTPLRRRRW